MAQAAPHRKQKDPSPLWCFWASGFQAWGLRVPRWRFSGAGARFPVAPGMECWRSHPGQLLGRFPPLGEIWGGDDEVGGHGWLSAQARRETEAIDLAVDNKYKIRRARFAPSEQHGSTPSRNQLSQLKVSCQK